MLERPRGSSGGTPGAAILAAEERGKLEFCLDQLVGSPPRNNQQFRQAWRRHTEKPENLVAYRAAFLDETTFQGDNQDVRARPSRIHHARMVALYVDFDGAHIQTSPR